VYYNKIVNHCSYRGNMMQALAQWQHPATSNEAQDVFHWAMHPTSYCRIHMVIKIASNSPAFLTTFDFVVTHPQM